MSQKETVGISVRFDLTNEDERRAWEYLKGIGKKEHRFYTQAIVTAVNDYYGRREQIISDPYLETREKEDAFIARVLEAVRCASPSVPVRQTPGAEEQAENDENVEAIFDFLDGFV